MKTLLIIFLSYLIGSIPFSYLFSRLKGRDLRNSGTKNVGATNVLIVAGPLVGLLAFIGDIAKGYLAIQLARFFFLSDWGVALCGLAAVCGHDFSLFLKFSGGKGVATTTGVVLAFDPLLAFIAILLWGLVVIITRYFILSTLIILGALPFLMWLAGWRFEYFFFSLLAFLLALYQHREDIQRLISGKEFTVSSAWQHYLR